MWHGLRSLWGFYLRPITVYTCTYGRRVMARSSVRKNGQQSSRSCRRDLDLISQKSNVRASTGVCSVSVQTTGWCQSHRINDINLRKFDPKKLCCLQTWKRKRHNTCASCYQQTLLLSSVCVGKLCFSELYHENVQNTEAELMRILQLCMGLDLSSRFCGKVLFEDSGSSFIIHECNVF